MGVAQFAASVLAPRLTDRLGTGRVLALSAVVQTAGLATVAATLWTGWRELPPLALAPGLLLCGAGQGLQLPTYFRVILSAVPSARAGAGSGLAATAQQSGLALGVATLGSLFLALIPALGMRHAFAIILGTQLAGLAGLALLSLRLPRRLG